MNRKKILVVDDEKDVLQMLGKRFVMAGYTVFSADNGMDAITMARSVLPDIIILDVAMPHMDGGHVAEKLKEDIRTENIPVIFLTCLITRKDLMESGHEIAGNKFFAKPYDIQELLAEVEKVV